MLRQIFWNKMLQKLIEGPLHQPGCHYAELFHSFPLLSPFCTYVFDIALQCELLSTCTILIEITVLTVSMCFK